MGAGGGVSRRSFLGLVAGGATAAVLLPKVLGPTTISTRSAERHRADVLQELLPDQADITLDRSVDSYGYLDEAPALTARIKIVDPDRIREEMDDLKIGVEPMPRRTIVVQNGDETLRFEQMVVVAAALNFDCGQRTLQLDFIQIAGGF